MNKRVIAAVAAAVLALLGVLVLVTWAQRADDRAFEGAKMVDVVRLTKDVAVGTSAAELKKATEVARLPRSAVPDGAVTSLDEVAGLATNASVLKGEVLLASRMARPGTKQEKPSRVPAGYQEVSIALDGERSVAGDIKPGDTVGVIVTTETGTNVVANQVLVTKVGTKLGSGNEGAATAKVVTIAVKTLDAEKIVHGQRWATVWLTLQDADTDTSGGRRITGEDVLR
jgi:pilus assembly protein CpaB